MARIRDHPAATFIDPLTLTGTFDGLDRAFVRCTTAKSGEEVGGDPIAACAARAREQGWAYREIATRHDPQLFAPKQIAVLIEELGSPM